MSKNEDLDLEIIDDLEDEEIIVEDGILKKMKCQKNISIPNGIGIKVLFGCKTDADRDDERFENDIFFHSLNWNSLLETLEMGDDVEIVGEKAFDNASSLKKVELSRNIKEIRMSAFLNCNNIKVIDLPESITKIEQWAFGAIEELHIWYHGTLQRFKTIELANEWCEKGTVIHCFDGEIQI